MFTTLTSDILCRSLYGRKMNIRGTLSFELLYYLYKQHNNDVIRFASLGRATRCSCLGLSSAAATSLGSCAPKGNGASARGRFEINYCVKSTGKKSTPTNERFSQRSTYGRSSSTVMFRCISLLFSTLQCNIGHGFTTRVPFGLKGRNLISGSRLHVTTPSTSFTNYTVNHVLKAVTTELEREGVPEPAESTKNLLAAALDLPWESGYRDLSTNQQLLSQRRLSKAEADALSKLLDRRKTHEPIQYILGQWDFLDYVIQVKPPLLCPRPETEELVSIILDETTPNDHLRILDIGCGTGCIGIALADKLPNAHVDAIDIEPIAIETARQNARRILQHEQQHRYRATLAPAAEYDVHEGEQKYDIIVSNPPYIPSKEVATLDIVVKNFESPDALDGGHDGYVERFTPLSSESMLTIS